MGHSRPGRLRQTPPSIVSGHRRLPDMLLLSQSQLLPQRSGQVVPGDQSPRAGRAQDPGGHQAGSQGQLGRAGEAAIAQAGPDHASSGGGHEEKDRSRRLPRVLRADTEWTERYIRRGDQGGSLS